MLLRGEAKEKILKRGFANRDIPDDFPQPGQGREDSHFGLPAALQGKPVLVLFHGQHCLRGKYAANSVEISGIGVYGNPQRQVLLLAQGAHGAGGPCHPP